MRISIITAIKNNRTGLLRAINCINDQTYQNVEHIIVDGGSTDGSLEVVDDEKLKIQNLKFVSEPDDGIYDAINKGIMLATGDVIGLLHSDDTLANENVLSSYADLFYKYDTDSIYSDLVYVDKNNKSIRVWKSGDYFPKKILDGWMPPHPTLFLRKKIFDKHGLYNTTFKIAADYEMVLRLFWKQKISTHYLPQTTYLMTLGGASNKSLSNIILKSKEDYRAMQINDVPIPFVTLIGKNIRKIPQFL